MSLIGEELRANPSYEILANLRQGHGHAQRPIGCEVHGITAIVIEWVASIGLKIG